MEGAIRPRALARGVVAICALGAAFSCVVSCAVRRAGESAPATDKTDNAGGTGARHKGAEGMMGDPTPAATAAPNAKDDQLAIKAKQKVAPLASVAPGMGYGGGGVAFDSSPKGGVVSVPDPFGSAGLGAAKLDAPAAKPLVALDPNARYATTYRPGGAALSAFDAALSHGALPASTKDLVGDFGSRYAPAIAAPTKEGMAFQVDLERSALGAAGGPLHLRIAMKGADGKGADGALLPWAIARAPLDVHVVLDISGSMQGASIDQAKKATEALVEKLAPTDRFSMTTFSSWASVVVPAGPIGPRKTKVLDTIHGIQADGGTNISAGLDFGYAEAQKAGAPDGAVKVVMLLSDGHANGGDTDPKHLALRAAKAFQEGVQTSTFGIGTDFDASLMATIADRGAGAYYYLADANQIAPALTKELEARLQPVATALEIRVRLRPDVVATKAYGSQVLDEELASLVRAQEVAADIQAQKKNGIAADRKDDAVGGMRFFIPAFARGDRHAMLLQLDVPKALAGMKERTVASIEIRYKDRALGKNVTHEIPVKLGFAATDEDSAKTIDKSVQTTVQAFSAGDAIVHAADLIDRGDRASALAVLRERAAVLRKAKDVLGAPELGDDANRLDRLSDAVFGPTQVEDPLVLAVLLRGSGSGYLR